MHTMALRNALIYDGSGSPPVEGDIALEADRIAAVGAVGAARDNIDVAGQAVSPGFIDVHTHDDFAAVIYPDMAFKLGGGVTTCIVGNCGMGAAPFPQAATLAKAIHPNKSLPDWGDYHGYLEQLDTHPPGVNIGVLVGHGTLRMAAMGREKQEPSERQMSAMKSMLQEGLDAGALGLSTGLIYEPGKYAGTLELIELAQHMAGSGGVYATHMRDEGSGLLYSIQEAIEIGERAQVPVQISHHKASGREAWGLVHQSLRLIETAQADGLDIHADQYPYTAGSTILSAVLADDVSDMRNLALADIVIAATAEHPDWEGKSVPEVAKELGETPDAGARRILELEPGATVILHSMNEEDVQTVMRHASTMIGSDGLPTLEGKPHPRLYGTFARVLGHYARDLNLFSLEEAIYRMTGFSARKFGLHGRGRIRENAFADLVVFDPARIIDTGTFEDPNHMPGGIERVFVNGVESVRAGQPLAQRAGRVLKRATRSPSP